MESTPEVNLRERITRNIADVKRWVRILSYLHNSLLFGAAVLSTMAAIILQLKELGGEALKRDLASILSALAALMGVIAASGSFDKKWRTFRWTLHRLLELELDLTPENMASEQMKERYKEIWRDHEKEIGGMIK